MQMKRREFLILCAGSLAAPTLGRGASAQSAGKMPVIGVLVAQSAPHPFPDAFKAGLQQLGYTEGRNIAIEWRYADGLYSRAVERATELVKLGVDVIAAHHTPAVKAAMSVTPAIPIVMSPAGAPLETGLVQSLARPGGNVTGLSSMEAELGSKRLNLLRDAMAGLKTVAVLASRSDPFTVPYLKDAETAAAKAGLTLHPEKVDGPNDFEAAFADMAKAGAQAVMIQPLFSPHDDAIVALAGKHRIAVMSSYRATTRAGGMISYSADHVAYFQRAATFVDKILKGAKPGDLPVEQPTKFELVVNLKTAKALGLAIPETFLLNADEVIE
jgi:putative tryptophan/tyrosine transport system substrate-binding protein